MSAKTSQLVNIKNSLSKPIDLDFHKKTSVNKMHQRAVSKLVLFLLTVLLLGTYSQAAKADFGRNLVYFDCQPKSSLAIHIMTLFEITPTLNDQTYDLFNLKESKTLECQITPNDKVTVKIGISKTPQNNNVRVLVNGELIGTHSFEDPSMSYGYIVVNSNNSPDITFTRFSVAKVEKKIDLHKSIAK